MNNRKRIEQEILDENPGATVEHKCGLPLSSQANVNGMDGKCNLACPMFCCPSCIPLCSEDKTAAEAKRLISEAAAFDMER